MKDSPEGAILVEVSSYNPIVLCRGHMGLIHAYNCSTSHLHKLEVYVRCLYRTCVYIAVTGIVIPLYRVACEDESLSIWLEEPLVGSVTEVNVC